MKVAPWAEEGADRHYKASKNGNRAILEGVPKELLRGIVLGCPNPSKQRIWPSLFYSCSHAAISLDGKTEINWMRPLNDFARNQLSHGEQNHGTEPASVTF